MKSKLKHPAFLSAAWRLCLVLGLASLCPSSLGGTLPAPDISSPGRLQVETLEFPDLHDPSREDPATPERPRLFGRRHSTPRSEAGRKIPIKVHFPTSGGPYPVVIASHGAGGSWDGHFAQARHLASYGYVVLCVEHVGSNTARLKSSFRILKNLDEMIHDSSEVLGRPKDIRFAIDRATNWNQSHSRLGGLMDLGHVAVLGHSFGAYTTLAVAGARPALQWIEPRIGSGQGLGPDLSDPRVRCGVALSPQAPGDPFFLRESFASLRVPVLGISGTKDQQHNGDSPIARHEAFKLWPESQGKNVFIWIENASHLDFSDSTGSGQRALRAPHRDEVQRVVRAATLLFLNACLKPTRSREPSLDEESLKPYLGGSVRRVEVRRK
jgi:predicted dienelactone hydrolase